MRVWRARIAWPSIARSPTSGSRSPPSNAPCKRGNSPFDDFAEGLRTGDESKLAALSPAAQRGMVLFMGRANCRLCHFGPNFSDGEFHSTGIPPRHGGELHDPARYEGVPLVKSDPFATTGPHSDDPTSRQARRVRSLVRSSEQWGQFRTPSLRNVALSPPYMHEGQLATLEDVVRHYSTLENAVLPDHHQEQLLVPLHLTEAEIAELVAFLEALTGADPALELP